MNELESGDIPRVSTFLKRFSSAKVVALQTRQHFRKIMKIPDFRHKKSRFIQNPDNFLMVSGRLKKYIAI